MWRWQVADSLVASETVRGVSGGERKRANIGVELIKNPSALFLDEVWRVNKNDKSLAVVG